MFVVLLCKPVLIIQLKSLVKSENKEFIELYIKHIQIMIILKQSTKMCYFSYNFY